MDFQTALLKEPRLVYLIYDANFYFGTVENDEKNRVWYEHYKPRMLKLVGFGAENKDLNSTEVYDMFYKYFIDLMEVK